MNKTHKSKKPERTQEEINQECYSCEEITCPKICFNNHVGSLIALQKLIDSIDRENGTKTYITG